MKRPENIGDVFWRSVDKKLSYGLSRYRGVLCVVSVPVLLVLAVILLVPRSSPLHVERPHTLTELRHTGPTVTTKYAIVFDAGSTGSRIHVFKFEQHGSGQLQLISDTFEQLKPGLSSYADEPEKAAASLQPLIDTALKTVPAALQKSTSISLKATAGLRLLPGNKSERILNAVEALLLKQPFKLAPGGVSIMDGKDEGAFAWLTLNYLLGKLAGPVQETVAAIDMGGGSIQEAFALDDVNAKAAPKDYVSVLRGAGKTYNIYVHSYLGYGLMAGRAKLIEAGSAGNAEGASSCFAAGASGKYAYAGKEYTIAPKGDKGDFGQCSSVGTMALNVDMACGFDKIECSFDGAWRGKGLSTGRQYYISSYFWDRALETGIIKDGSAIMWPTSVKDFDVMAADVCGKSVDDVAKAYPKVQGESAKFLCMDLTFSSVMLTKGFKLDPAAKLTLVKQVEYNNQRIEAAWPLGAAVNDLSSP